MEKIAKAERRTKSALFRDMLCVYKRHRQQLEQFDEKWAMHSVGSAFGWNSYGVKCRYKEEAVMGTSQQHTIRTMCPMNCHPTLCGMLVDIDHGRLVGVRGDKENPDSQGFLCVRGQASQEIIDNPQRLLYPLIRHRRTDDAWRQASWDEALDLIAARMQAAGREAVGIWAGHGVFSTNGQASFEAMVEVAPQ